MILAAFRRFAVLLGGAIVAVSACSLALGLVLGSTPARAVSLGLTVVGAFMLLSGFFVGNRGPVRVKDEDTPLSGPFVFGNRLVRWATPGEREETLNLSAVFVVVGFALILLGVAVDPRYTLF